MATGAERLPGAKTGILGTAKRALSEAALAGLGLLGGAGGGLPVLHYHSVNGEDQSSVTALAFKRQMAHLKEKGYRTVTVEQALGFLSGGGGGLPGKCVAITFDDGYRTVREIALGALMEHGFTATVFLTTGFAGKAARWEGSSMLEMMSWADVREAASLGICFGAHTETHPRLTRIPPEKARREVEGSKARLEDETGREVKCFAYPYGDYNDAVKAVVRGAGLACAFTTEPGLNTPGLDMFCLRRSGVFRDTSCAGFRTRLNGTFRWYFYGKRKISNHMR